MINNDDDDDGDGNDEDKDNDDDNNHDKDSNWDDDNVDGIFVDDENEDEYDNDNNVDGDCRIIIPYFIKTSLWANYKSKDCLNTDYFISPVCSWGNNVSAWWKFHHCNKFFGSCIFIVQSQSLTNPIVNINYQLNLFSYISPLSSPHAWVLKI